MARLFNLARVLSTTAGTGSVTLGPAVQGFLTFAQAGVPDGTEVSYGIRDGANSEVGTGVYSSSGPTLTRASVTNSTNLGAYINLSGSEEVYITARAEDIGVPDMSYSGMQINGGMEVSQENGAAAVGGISNTGKYIVDGWYVSSSGAQVLTAALNATCPPGFGYSLQAYPTTLNAAPAATDICAFKQNIEGYRIAKLAWGTSAASPITIGFWVYAARAGLYSGSVSNLAGNRSYVFAFTVNVAATFEYKTVTIPGDTAGTWEKTNFTGISLGFTMMAGASLQTAPGVWNAAVFAGATGTTNGVGVTGDTMLIAGITVLPGTQAPTAAQSPNIMRPYDQELVTCQRYWQLAYGNIRFQATNTNPYENLLTFRTMRAVPTYTSGTAIATGNVGAFQINSMQTFAARTYLAAAGAGDCYVLMIPIYLDARL